MFRPTNQRGSPHLPDSYERYRWLLVALLAAPLLFAAGWLLRERWNDPDPLTIETSSLPAGEIQVYVTGAVQHPGVYPLPDGSRWIDAVEAAGGATDDADLAGVNLAKRAEDEDQVSVPRIGEVVAGAVQAPLVNLNVADEAELATLPGIGETRAQKIIQSRTTDGPFSQVEDLVLRDLVPTSVFQEIAPMITVN
jgi:competence protein ComEA